MGVLNSLKLRGHLITEACQHHRKAADSEEGLKMVLTARYARACHHCQLRRDHLLDWVRQK